MRCLVDLRDSSTPPTTPTAALNTDTPRLVRVSCCPFLSFDAWVLLLPLLELEARPDVDPDRLVVLRELERERLAPDARDRLEPFLAGALREPEPDRLVPFLDVEREDELSVRFA